MGKIVQVEEGSANQSKQYPAPSSVHRRDAKLNALPATYLVAVVRDRISGADAETNNGARTIDSEAPVGGLSKRMFDICVSLVGIVMLAPVLVLIALAVRIDSSGPALFKQDRGGFGGRAFRIYKFRTVRPGDARITRIGDFLRRSSWDELPQLFNVLMGHMSIIGPRPHCLEHDQQFEAIDPRYDVRRRARPGVTGLAQVSGCGDSTGTVEKVRRRTGFDAEYVHRWSWLGELKILAASVMLLFKDDPGAI